MEIASNFDHLSENIFMGKVQLAHKFCIILLLPYYSGTVRKITKKVKFDMEYVHYYLNHHNIKFLL